MLACICMSKHEFFAIKTRKYKKNIVETGQEDTKFVNFEQ